MDRAVLAPPLRPAVFVDRDGVLNRTLVVAGKPYAPRRLADFRLLPFVAAGVESLRAAGFRVLVVTNQPDIGNGLVDPAVVEAMHARLRARLAVDEVLVCPHSQDAGCACRKPKPGLLIQAAARWSVDLQRSYMIGDRASDVIAGQAAGCFTIYVRRGYAEKEPQSYTERANSFAHAARIILRRAHQETE